MRSFFTVDQVRRAESVLFSEVAAGVPMQRAAYGLARVIAGELRTRTGGIAGRHIGLLVGSGDNGGDVLWAGAMLRNRGVAVSIDLLNPERAHKEGLAAARNAGARVVDELPADVDLAIDGIIGISGAGPLRPEAARKVAAITAPIIAADLPSGVDPDTGRTSGPHVTAAVTVTFGSLKPVHALGAQHCGRIELVPIGLRLNDPHLRELTLAETGEAWPVPGADDDKYSGGVVGIRAGSEMYPGAAVLCCSGAVAASSSMVRYCGPSTDQVISRWPEVVPSVDLASTGKVQAWVVGPGMGTDRDALNDLVHILEQDLPVVIDADAITMLALHKDLVIGRIAPTLVTPHRGEFARLGGDPDVDRVTAVKDLATELGVTILLKGRATVISGTQGHTWVNDAGSSWAATPGSGDVLSGVIGALLAAGIDPSMAAAMAARAHSEAAIVAAGTPGAPISASILAANLTAAIRRMRGSQQ